MREDTIQELLKAREELMEDIKANTSIEKMIEAYAKSAVSRRYKHIVKQVGAEVEVIWGNGGAQTKKIRELTRDGIEFIHISDTLLNGGRI